MSTQPHLQHSVQHTQSLRVTWHDTTQRCAGCRSAGRHQLNLRVQRGRACVGKRGSSPGSPPWYQPQSPIECGKLGPKKLKCATASSTPSLLCSYTDLGEMIMHTHTQEHSGRRIDRHAADEQHAITSKGKSDGEFRAEICQTDLSPLSPHSPLALSLLLPPPSTPPPYPPFLDRISLYNPPQCTRREAALHTAASPSCGSERGPRPRLRPMCCVSRGCVNRNLNLNQFEQGDQLCVTVCIW